MGYDIAYHTINIDILTKEIIPYILGHTDDIESFLQKCYQIENNRFIANTIGLKVDKLLKNSTKSFDSSLYIFGRPFFVTEDDLEKMTFAIDQYLSVNCQEVITSQLNNLGIQFSEVQLTEEDLKNKPSYDGVSKINKDLLDKIKLAIEFLKQTENKILCGKEGDTILKFSEEDDDSLNMTHFLKKPFILIDVISSATPAWMDRGLVNPSTLIEETNLEFPPYVKSASYLLKDVAKMLEFDTSKTPQALEENFDLGMVIYPEDISEFVIFFKKHYSIFFNYLIDQEIRSEDAALNLRKAEEALYYAKAKNLAFIESTEIFSCFAGRVP